MPKGERVTTGSEPTTIILARRGDAHIWQSVHRGRAEQLQRAGWQVIEVQEAVEPGHDEQTEERVAWSKALQQAQAEVEAERERTVAAVVEALRDRRPHPWDDSDRAWFDGIMAAADFIEERFKPSAPGGGNGQ